MMVKESIKVDGDDVRQYDRDTLHKIVGYIQKKAGAFSGGCRLKWMGETNSSPLDDDKVMVI